MNEFELINRYFKRGNFSSGLPLGIGDDCAVVAVPDNHQLVMSVDTLVSGVHFLENSDPSLIAQRAVRVALSDLAAMGAEPLCFTLALTIPHVEENWLRGFSNGLHKTADEFECELVGGDTTRGPLTISIQVQGLVPAGEFLCRDGAGVGDMVCVSGCLGDGAAALELLRGDLKMGVSASRYLSDRFYRPTPRLDLGKKLRGLASAAIDISDGFIADLGHICKASGVGAELDVDTLPVSEPVFVCADTAQWRQWALTGGDDYELCFTVPQRNASQLSRMINNQGLDITVVGHIIGEREIRSAMSGELLTQGVTGYQHF